MLPGSNEGHYDVFWPRTPRQAKTKPLARRLDTLAGKRVAELWNFMFYGDEVYGWLEEEMKARFPGVQFVSYSEFGSIHGKDEREVLAALPRRLKELGVDAVISAMGA